MTVNTMKTKVHFNMSVPFFYKETIDLNADHFHLNEETSRHIVQVLRMKVGEEIQLTDGKGNLLNATIIDAHKKNCVVKKSTLSFSNPPELKNTIAISLIKNTSRFEWFLEKSTEIGITKIIPLLCERTEKQHLRIERLKGIIVSAMIQSKQTRMPELTEPLKFNEIVKNNNDTEKYIAHCDSDLQKKLIGPRKENNSCIVLIGPEGDFSSEEISLAKSNGFLPVSLGTTRLRTETAGVVASVLLTQTSIIPSPE